MFYRLFIIVLAILFASFLNAQDALFEVQNETGTSIFSVYPDGIRIMGMSLNADDSNVWIDNAEGDKLFIASADSIRFYLYENDTDDSRGGFAVTTVGSTSDEPGSTLMDLTPENYFIGHESGRITTGLYNSFMGYQAGYNNIEGDRNLFYGYQSGYMNDNGRLNSFFGYHAGYSNIGGTGNLGSYNVFMGNEAGKQNETGYHNTFLGHIAGKNSVAGFANTFIGSSTGMYNTGDRNTYVGSGSGLMGNSGSFNTYLGSWSGQHNQGSNNVFIGFQSGFGGTSTSYSNNTCLGTYSGENLSGSGNVLIGYRAGRQNVGSNKLYIANGATADSTLIYGDFAAQSIGIAHLSPSNRLSLGGSGSANGIALGGDQAESCVLYHSSAALKMSAPNSRFQFGSLEYIQDGGAYETEFNSDLRPSVNDYYDLGTSSYRWRTVYATNGVINTSDVRDKENIVPVEYGIAEIMQMNPVSFNWLGRSSESSKLGLIAQELLTVVPEVVKTHEEELISEDSDETQLVEMESYGIYYADLIPVLIKGMQEQQKIIEELRQEIEIIKKGNN